MEDEIKPLVSRAGKKYELFYSIRRSRDALSYVDYHSLICQIREKGNEMNWEPLGVKSVLTSTDTRDGHYDEGYSPFIGQEAFYGLAKLVAQSFPFQTGDEVSTHSYGGMLNVIQFPLSDDHLKRFEMKLKELT